jgi:hypothetical protein
MRAPMRGAVHTPVQTDFLHWTSILSGGNSPLFFHRQPPAHAGAHQLPRCRDRQGLPAAQAMVMNVLPRPWSVS